MEPKTNLWSKHLKTFKMPLKKEAKANHWKKHLKTSKKLPMEILRPKTNLYCQLWEISTKLLKVCLQEKENPCCKLFKNSKRSQMEPKTNLWSKHLKTFKMPLKKEAKANHWKKHLKTSKKLPMEILRPKTNLYCQLWEISTKLLKVCLQEKENHYFKHWETLTKFLIRPLREKDNLLVTTIKPIKKSQKETAQLTNLRTSLTEQLKTLF